MINLIIDETKAMNTEGRSFSIAESVNAQLPFFACKNIILDKQAQKSIERYLYCEKFGVAPYEGGYGKQPKKWVDTSFVIRSALAEREASEIKKAKNKK